MGDISLSIIHLQVTAPVSVGPDLERIAINLVGEEAAEEKGREKEERKEEEEGGGVKEERGRRNPKEEKETEVDLISLSCPLTAPWLQGRKRSLGWYCNFQSDCNIHCFPESINMYTGSRN